MPESLALNPGAVALGKITGQMPPCRPALTGERLRDPPLDKNAKFYTPQGLSGPRLVRLGWDPLPGTSAKAASGARLPVLGASGPVTPLNTHIPDRHKRQAIEHTTKKKPRPNQNWIRAAHPHLGRSHDLQGQINGRTAGWL